MRLGTTVYTKTRTEWRAWLRTNHKTEPEIWLIFFTKASGKPRLPYNHAVDEALCFGWIDGSRNRPDFFKRRLAYFIKMTAKDKRFGMVQ